MTMRTETKIGLTFGQIIAVISLAASMVTGYISLKTDIAVLKNEGVNVTERITRHEQSNKEDLRTIVIDVKESLKEIKSDIKEIKENQ